MLRAALQHLALWQVKEFRWDRVIAHLRLPSARAVLLSPLAISKWVLLGWWLFDMPASSGNLASALLIFLYAGETVWFGREVLTRTHRRPRVSPRIGILLFGGILVTLLLLHVGRATGWPWPFTLLLVDRALPTIVAGAVLATVPLTLWKRQHTIARAGRRLRTAHQLTRVGITGSVGKSSTKEFLATLTEEHFRVVKTPANINTDIGIAQTVLRELRDGHTLFVSEMGAYRRGEIARAARLVQPQIGILTAVRNQHLALFGSLEDLARAKGELLRAVPKSGTAIVNGDDPICMRLSKETPAAQVIRYGFNEGNDVRGEVRSTHRDHFELMIRSGKGTHHVTVPLLGEHQAGNVLAAWAAGEALGIPSSVLAERTRLLRPLPRTMEPRIGLRGSFVIDDTYSANPDGVVAALAYLPSANAKTVVVVLTTMIELGSASGDAHRRVGDMLQRVKPDLTVVVGRDFADALITAPAVEGAPVSRMVIEPHAERAFELVKPHLGPETLVLLEGRIPETLRQKFFVSP